MKNKRIRKLYPNGKRKAFSLTYDDGVLQDIPFVRLLNQYGLKATFNLNSDLMKHEFEWTHPCGMTVKRLSCQTAQNLYAHHEIASHTLTHPYMDNLSEAEIMNELRRDKENLETLFGREVRGFAVPFDYYSDLIKNCVKNCGFDYARISEESYAYTPETDYYAWRAGIFHLSPKLNEYVDHFLQTDEELAVCQIVGHTYDLDTEQCWGTMEDIFKKICANDDILPMTTIELVDYLKAMEQCVITDACITNNSSSDLWFDIDGAVVKVCPEETVSVR